MTTPTSPGSEDSTICSMAAYKRLPDRHHAYVEITGPANSDVYVATPQDIVLNKSLSVAAGFVRFDKHGVASVKIANLDNTVKHINKGQAVAYYQYLFPSLQIYTMNTTAQKSNKKNGTPLVNICLHPNSLSWTLFYKNFPTASTLNQLRLPLWYNTTLRLETHDHCLSHLIVLPLLKTRPLIHLSTTCCNRVSSSPATLHGARPLLLYANTMFRLASASTIVVSMQLPPRTFTLYHVSTILYTAWDKQRFSLPWT